MSAPTFTAGEYLLKFNNVPVGDWVDNMLCLPKLISKIGIRQNFWSTQAIIQHQWPAFIWDHKFTIYAQQASRESFAEWFMLGYAALFALGGRHLVLWRANLPSGSPVPLIDFGTCYLSETPAMKEPQQHLQFAAGLSSMTFISADMPSFSNIDS